MPSGNEREQGEFAQRLKQLEKDMEDVIGKAVTSHASRIGNLETDKKERDIRTSLVTGAVGLGVSFFVWFTGSGLAAKMDAMHHDMMARKPGVERVVAP